MMRKTRRSPRVSANLAAGPRWRAKKSRYARCEKCGKRWPLRPDQPYEPDGWGQWHHDQFSCCVGLYCPPCYQSFKTAYDNRFKQGSPA